MPFFCLFKNISWNKITIGVVMLKKIFSYEIFFFGIILSLNCPAFAQTNIDSISGRFQQLSKQLADLEKYVYNNGGNGSSVISSGHQKRIEAKVVKFPFYDPEKKKVKS